MAHLWLVAMSSHPSLLVAVVDLLSKYLGSTIHLTTQGHKLHHHSLIWKSRMSWALPIWWAPDLCMSGLFRSNHQTPSGSVDSCCLCECCRLTQLCWHEEGKLPDTEPIWTWCPLGQLVSVLKSWAQHIHMTSPWVSILQSTVGWLGSAPYLFWN
jgi:hypothetical protein